MLPPPRPSPRGGGGDGFASLAIFGSLRFALLALSVARFACLLASLPCFACLPRLVASLGCLLLCWVVLDACALVVVLNCLLWPLGLTAAICCLPWPIPLAVSLSACHAACFGRLPQVLAMPLALAVFLSCSAWLLLRPSSSVAWHGPSFGRLLYCCKVHALPSCLPFGPDCLLRPPPFWLARTGNLDFDLLALDVLRYWQPVYQWEGSSRPGQAVGQEFRSIQARARGK